MERQTTMFKNREIVLYFLTAFLCAFVDDLRILPAIVIVDVLMLVIMRIWCGKLLSSFDVEKKKSYIDNPLSKKLEDFYAFSDVPGVEMAENNEDKRYCRESGECTLFV